MYLPTSAEFFPGINACKSADGFSNQIFTGVLTFVMGVVTMVRMTRNMPKRLTDSNLYSSSMHGIDDMIKTRPPVYESPEAAVSRADYLIMMKRMNELEEKLSIVCQKPPTMAPEKEEMLNNALTRIDALEQELQEAKKVGFLLHLLLFYTLQHANYLHLFHFFASCSLSSNPSHNKRSSSPTSRRRRRRRSSLPSNSTISFMVIVDMAPGVCCVFS